MTKALTARAVEAAQPDPDKRVEIRDGALVGLRLVIQPSGKKSWALRYTFGGRYRKMTLGRYPALTLLDARGNAREALQQAEEGTDPAAARLEEKAKARDPERIERDKLKSIVKAYLNRKGAKLRSADHVRRYFETELLPKLGEHDIQTITRRDLVDLLDAIVDRGSPITANRVFANTRALFNWAKGRGVISESPLDGMTMPAEEKSRDRVLSGREIRVFWQATEELGEPFGPLYRLLLLTGQRLREVAHMTESEISGEVWTIPGKRAKNGEPHAVPLSPLALATLKAARRIKSDAGYLFTTNGETPVSGFTKAKARLDKAMARLASVDAGEPVEIEPFVIHDLRRTAASGMAELRIAPHICEAVLNHRSGTVSGIARVYNRHDYADEKREALEAWANRVAAIVGEQTPNNVVALEARR